MLSKSGSLTGELLAGLLAVVLPGRLVLMIFMLISAVASIIIIGGNRNRVSGIYNTQA